MFSLLGSRRDQLRNKSSKVTEGSASETGEVRVLDAYGRESIPRQDERPIRKDPGTHYDRAIRGDPEPRGVRGCRGWQASRVRPIVHSSRVEFRNVRGRGVLVRDPPAQRASAEVDRSGELAGDRRSAQTIDSQCASRLRVRVSVAVALETIA